MVGHQVITLFSHVPNPRFSYRVHPAKLVEVESTRHTSGLPIGPSPLSASAARVGGSVLAACTTSPSLTGVRECRSLQ